MQKRKTVIFGRAHENEIIMFIVFHYNWQTDNTTRHATELADPSADTTDKTKYFRIGWTERGGAGRDGANGRR